MKPIIIVVLLIFSVTLAVADEEATKDLVEDLDSEDLERGHRRKKRKKWQNNGGNGCGTGGYGRTFGEKFFGVQDYTYVSAPVMNYFFGCGVGVPVAPTYPVAHVPYPVNVGVSQSHGHGHGHRPHHHQHHQHGHGGSTGGLQPQGLPGHFGGYPSPYSQQFNQNQPYQQPYNRPVQNVVSAAAAGPTSNHSPKKVL